MEVKGEDGKVSLALPPEVERLKLGFTGKSKADIPAYLEKVKPVAEEAKNIHWWNTSPQAAAMRTELKKTVTDPQELRILNSAATRDNLGWLQQRRNMTRPVVSGAGIGVEAEPSLRDQAAMIGEHIIPEWMKPKPGVNY